MEEILKKLQKEASGSKHKAIKESCTWALGKRKERGAGRRAPASLSGAGAPARCSPRAARAGAETAPLRRGLLLSICYGCISRNSESCLSELMCAMRIWFGR